MGQAAASSGIGRLELNLDCDISAVEQARLALEDYLAPLALDARVTNRLEVVLEELVSNVARHASEADLIRIEAETTDADIHLHIIDDGAPFDPLAVDEHEGFDSLDDARLGGLGIPLVRRLTRSASYLRDGERNRVDVVIAR